MSKVYMKLGHLPLDPAEIEIEVSYSVDDDGDVDVGGIKIGGYHGMQSFILREISPDYHKALKALRQAVIQHLKAEGELARQEIEGDRRAANEFYSDRKTA